MGATAQIIQMILILVVFFCGYVFYVNQTTEKI